MALCVKLYQQLLVFALSAEEDLIAVGIFPAGEIEAVGALKDFTDVQGVRPGGDYFKADNTMLRIEHELSALAKVRSVGRGQQEAIGGPGDSCIS